jgi:long-chain fatty acid transport protein
MSVKSAGFRAALAVGGSLVAMSVSSGAASAGGFDVREQSALFQGMSFAGAAAGGTSLGSMFWNPAAAGYVGDGITFDSTYSLILPRADLTIETINGLDASSNPLPPVFAPFNGLDRTVDVGRDALVPASYFAYRFSDDLVFAMGLNSQFGLTTKPDNTDWMGAVVGRTSKVFSVNATPTVAYQVAPWLQVGAGVQIQYFDLMKFKAATSPDAGSPSSVLEGDDWGFGYTLGINLTPMRGTSIGIGFRSSIEHELEGSAEVVGAPSPFLSAPITANLELPEKLTASLRQEITPTMRAFATVEWTNWSRLKSVPVILGDNFILPMEPVPPVPALPAGSPVATLDFEWEDGWYFALGGEYDYSDKLTLRTGIGYEISPIREPQQRLVQLPDNDRIWLSLGASYDVGDLFGLLKNATIDVAYTHIFVEDGDFERYPSSTLALGLPVIAGSVDASVDILSVGIRSSF